MQVVLRPRSILAFLALAVCGCQNGDRAPELDPIGDQLVAVGQQLTVMLQASDPDGDELTYDFTSSMEHLAEGGKITRRPDGTAVFRWTPLGSDVGSWYVDFTVSDGERRDTATVLVEVQPLLGDGTMPRFREPLGSGVTLDLEQGSCVDIPITIEDLDDAAVDITQEAPLIEGAELTAQSGLTARWLWCPQKHQLAQERHVLRLAADDHRNPKVVKDYLIVLRHASGESCPGAAPVIEHTAADASSVLDVSVTAYITDDVALKHEPIVYYSRIEPRLPLDFSALELVTMTRVTGDDKAGSWTARLPNPIVDGEQGDSAPLYYIISAGDNDDAQGECDHVTDAPQDGFYTVMVTHPGGTGELPICEPCSADVQCGGANDLCLPRQEGGVCGQACQDADECPSGFTCVSTTSRGGVEAKQCVGAGSSCIDASSCEDDAREENDTRVQASTQPALSAGSYEGLRSCGGDDDWYRVQLAQQGTLGAVLEGGSASNLNLGLYDASGNALELSEQPGSSDVVESCLPAGTYYLRAYAFGAGDNDYDLLVETTPQTCSLQCVDDDLENNDSRAQAVTAEIYPSPYVVTDRAICSGDDDYYAVELYTNETLIVDLTFEQTSLDEDIDLHFLDATGVDLTPCTEQNPATCSVAQGQGNVSNERYTHHLTTPGCAPCQFYVVVHGWAGSENTYDMQMTLQFNLNG